MTPELAAEVRRLRTQAGLSVRQIQQQLGLTKTQLRDTLRGVPPPEWTRRPNAKDQLREVAQRLRREGWSVPDIAIELNVARSTAFRWTRHTPLDGDTERARLRREHSKRMTDARWAKHRSDRDRRRADVEAEAAERLGSLDRRDLMLLGAAIYWCEGTKAKPWHPDHALTFTNSDPRLLDLYLGFLEAVGIDRTRPTYRVAIHESADVQAAQRWWAERLGLPEERFQRPTVKRHQVRTNRRNIGAEYRGCLVIRVPRSREVYWYVEGLVHALAAAARLADLG